MTDLMWFTDVILRTQWYFSFSGRDFITLLLLLPLLLFCFFSHNSFIHVAGIFLTVQCVSGIILDTEDLTVKNYCHHRIYVLIDSIDNMG